MEWASLGTTCIIVTALICRKGYPILLAYTAHIISLASNYSGSIDAAWSKDSCEKPWQDESSSIKEREPDGAEPYT
jgi:hypothetical protein